MAFTAKFTGKRGKVEIADIAITAGSAEAQSDTVSINIDVTNISKGESLQLIDKIRDRIHAASWPPA
jgi:hypothetical protein